MHIFHYITDFSSTAGPQTSVVRAMMLATSKAADNTLLTCMPLSEDMAIALERDNNIKVRYMPSKKGNNPIEMLSFLYSVSKTLKQHRPDIVHVHGSWDWRTAIVERVARQQHIVTVVSPHRGMSLELIGIDFWKEKLPKLVAFQVWMVRNCTSVMAENEKERDVIVSLLHKRRIEVMPQIQNDEAGMKALGDALLTAYQKCLDTVYVRFLTQKERNVVDSAIRSLVADDDIETPLPDVTGVSFRRIYFHAYDEDVMQQFIDGCNKMHLQVEPPQNMAVVVRYRNPKAKQRGPLDDVIVKEKTLRLPAEKTAERNAVIMLCKAKKLGMSRLTLRHYTELYALYRYNDFDEDMVRAELKRLHMLGFAKKIQKRLGIMFGLKDGYSIA